MHTPVFVILEECPLPCSEVVLLRRNDSRALIAFCAICGAGWPDPRDAHACEGVGDLRGLEFSPENYAPAGASLPTIEQVRAAKLLDIVLREIDAAAWNGSTDALVWLAKQTRQRG